MEKNIETQKPVESCCKDKKCGSTVCYFVLLGIIAFLLFILSCTFCSFRGDIYKLKQQVNELSISVETVKQESQQVNDLSAAIETIKQKTQQVKNSVVGITKLFAPGILENLTGNSEAAEAPVKTEASVEVGPIFVEEAETSYDMTFERYASMPENLRLTFLHEHYKSSSLAMGYLIAAFMEAGEEEVLDSLAGERIGKLLSIWNILQQEPFILQAVDKLIVDNEFFEKEFVEAAELGGLMVLMEATSQLDEAVKE